MINRSRYIAFLESYQAFSIRLLVSKHPLVGTEPGTPAPSLRDAYAPPVVDTSLFQADPFIVEHKGAWHLFYEAFREEDRKGVIGVLRSQDLENWEYLGVALEEETHVSFPNVFEWKGAFWMVPETRASGQTSIYHARDFPFGWHKNTVLFDFPTSDSVLWEHDGMFYALTSPKMETLLLFWADSPLGPWHSHPLNPIVANDLRAARPGGPIAFVGRRMFRFAQDCLGTYGRQLFAFEILELSKTTYKERPASIRPSMGPGKEPWRAGGMHHLHTLQMRDGRWLSVMDGWTKRRRVAPPWREYSPFKDFLTL